jgi:hypothetical protein
MKILYLLLFLTVVACSPCKRIARLATKHPYCVDTAVKVRVDTIKGDTLRFYFHSTKTELDTVWHTKEGVRIHVVRQKDTLMVEGSCPPCDTIHHFEHKVVKVPVRQSEGTPWWMIAVICGMLILLILLALRK